MDSPAEVTRALETTGYLADESLSTVVFLAGGDAASAAARG